MMPLILLTAAGLAAADPAAQVLEAAATAEMERALSMSLPDQPSPYFVGYEILDGQVATAAASFGSLSMTDTEPYRNVRIEVRVGDYAFDNGNFDVSFGERDGVRQRALPTDPVLVAQRREMWLATDHAYKGAAEQFSAKQAARQGVTHDFGPDLYPAPPLTTDPLPSPVVDGQAVEAIVQRLTGALAERSWLEEADAIARDWQGRRIILNSEGTRAYLPTGFSVVRIEALTRAEDGASLRNCRWWVATRSDQLPSADQMEAEVLEMSRWLEGLRGAPVESDYLGPVLFEEAAAAELFRQLVLGEISGTPPAERAPDPYVTDEGTAPPTARIGRRLLPEGWSIVDDPAGAQGQAGHYTHDFQAVAAQRVELVRDGVVRDVLMSRVPREGKEASTGHGRSLGAQRREALPGAVTVTPARPRSTRRLRARAMALARQAGLDYVLVIKRLVPPAMAEDFSIAFSGEGPLPGLTRPLEAYRLYPDGREEPVRGLRFVGVDRRVLRDIAVAGTVGAPVGVLDSSAGAGRFGIGPIGGLPASWTVPPVVITELELQGSGGREDRVLPIPPS